ncbi:MAG: hypothetical protein LQ349_002051 [Xanthoria aureola]|nr:MAG: hypothetical protein LQ349_002051 [Xanthoria aureola]
MLSPHGSFSEHAVHRGITTTDLQRDPDLPASHQTQEGSQHEAPVNATQQSSVSAMQIQRGESGVTRSQTANPRKRRNPVEKTHGDEVLQPPHKNLKQRRTIACEENSSILRSTELSPTIRLSGGNGLRRYQPHREVKILPTIEHPIDPGHPRHSAYPRDDPLKQDLNEDNAWQHCSQVADARHVSYNASSPGASDPFEPNKSSNPDLYSRGGFFRGPEHQSREGDHDGSTQVNKYPEEAAYPDAEMTSRARVKREATATMKSTSRRSVSWQPPDHDYSLLAGSRLDFGLAEGSAVARLRRELAEMRTKVDSICRQTNPQMDPQGQARRKGAARSEKANNIMSDHPPKPGPAMTNASAPANTSTSVIDHQLSKGTANHGSVGLIERGSRHCNGEKSKKSSVATSKTTEGQPKSSTGTASIHIDGATDHREGRTVIRPDALTHQQRKPVDRERGNIFASSARSSTNEQARLRGLDTPTPSQRPRVHLAATRANQAYATSPSYTSRTRHPSDGYGLVPAGLSVKSADTSKYPVTPRSHQAVDSDDVEALGWKHSEISECGQILKKALLEDEMYEPEVAGSTKNNNQDSPHDKSQQQDHVRSQGQHASNTTVLGVGRRLSVISNGMALHSRPRFQQSRSRTPDMPENTPMSGGSDEDLLRQGTTFADPSRPWFQDDHSQDNPDQRRQALSYPNTIEVHPPSHTTGQRRPARPVGNPLSPLTKSARDPKITGGKIGTKESSSKSHECSAVTQSCNAAISLTEPASSSPPVQAWTEDLLQLPNNDDEAPQSSPRPIPSHDIAQQPQSVNTSTKTSLAAPDSINPRPKSTSSAATPSRGTPALVEPDSSSVEVPSTHEAHQETPPANDLTSPQKLIQKGKSPSQRAKPLRRRHATEPLHSPNLMSPVKALKQASQHPPSEPLFPVRDSALNRPQTPPATVALRSTTTATTTNNNNNKPAVVRPLWTQTPPPTPRHTRKKTYIPVAELKARKPERSRHAVWPQDREPDANLIEYGKLRWAYDRHVAAPYAFRYCGKLRAEYHYLAGLRGADGELLWEEGLGRRLRKR